MPPQETLSTQDVTPPQGYSLVSSNGKPRPLKDLMREASTRSPVLPPKGYVLDKDLTLLNAVRKKNTSRPSISAAPDPSTLEQLRQSVANTAIGHSLESMGWAKPLGLTPTETVNSPDYQAHKEQLLAPEYAAPAAADSLGLGQTGGERLEGALKGVGELTSAPNAALMAGTAVAAGLTAGVINPASAQLLSRAVSGGFTLDMLYGLYQQNNEYKQAVDSGNLSEAHRIQGEMGVTGIMALLAGKHALTKQPIAPVTEVPARERTNVLHRNGAGEVRQASGQAPTVWLNPESWEHFMGTLYPDEDPTATHGLTLPANEHLHSFATDPQLAAASPKLGDVQQLLAEAHKNADNGGVAIANQRPSLQANVNVMREELNHTWQRSLAENGNVHQHLNAAAFSDLYQSIPGGMYDHLLDNGYNGYYSPEMVTEAAAKLMDGRPERFGVDNDDAVDFLDKYFKQVTDQHGAKALEELQHVRGIAADAKARAIEEHGRTGARQDNGTIPSVGDRGQGGDAQGVPTEGEVNATTEQTTQTPIPAPVPEAAPQVSNGDTVPQGATEAGASGLEAIKTPEFRSWFGKSQVADENGDPIRLYHGTNRAGFDSFDKDILNPNSLYGSGVYTTDDPKVASGYAQESSVRGSYNRDELRRYFAPGTLVHSYGGGLDRVIQFKESPGGSWDVQVQAVDKSGNPLPFERPRWHSTMPSVEEVNKKNGGSKAVYPLFASIQKPFDIDGQFTREDAEGIFGKYNKTGWIDRGFKDDAEVDRTIGGTPREGTPTVSGKLLYEYAQQAFDDYTGGGRDPDYEPPRESDLPSNDAQSAQDQVNHLLRESGYDGIKHTGGRITKGNAHNVWIAFKPEQIKSAIGNSGAFDPKDPNILRNREKVDKQYPKVGEEVAGLKVRDSVPNTGSISSTFTDYSVLPGIREIPMSQLSGPESEDKLDKRTKALLGQIRENKEINPLIVAIDKEGPWILEGGHRFDALSAGGYKSFPAMVVIDQDEEVDDGSGVRNVFPEASDDKRGGYSGDKEDIRGGENVSEGDVPPKTNGDIREVVPSASGVGDGGEGESDSESLENRESPSAVSTSIPIQGGTQLASAPVHNQPKEKVHTSVPHQTTTQVSVPLQTAMDVTPVMTKRVLPLSQVKVLAAGLNPQRQPRSVREVMEEAKSRMGNQIVP